MKSQIATANISTKSRTLPYAFTEHGVAMLSSILRSNVAIDVNIKIISTFIELRKIAPERADLTNLEQRIYTLETKQKHREPIDKEIILALKYLMDKTDPNTTFFPKK